MLPFWPCEPGLPDATFYQGFESPADRFAILAAGDDSRRHPVAFEEEIFATTERLKRELSELHGRYGLLAKSEA